MTKFEYLDVVQRTPEWFKARMGHVTASRLSDWMAVSKAKGKEGTPLKAREDYERELWFERKFGVSFNNYVSEAMLDGQDFEEFACLQYEKITKTAVRYCGIFFSDEFAASPDRLVGTDGLIETKIVRDNTFTEILLIGVPEKHYKQIQGQLWASGRKWCDYVAINLNTRKISIWRVTANADFQKELEESLKVPISVEEVSLSELHDIQGELPERATMNLIETEAVTRGGMESW